MMDLATGRQQLLLEKVNDWPNEFLTSPAGKYIALFQAEKFGGVYDIAADVHRCISYGLGVNWEK